MSERALQTVIVVIIAATVIPAGTIFYSAGVAGQPDNSSAQAQVNVDSSDLPGDGSSSSPYEISNVSELQAMENDLDANYRLVSNIDASSTAQWNDGAGFDPVGDGSGDFKGDFDGNGYNITGLVVNRSSSGEEVGLFGEIENAVIESVHVDSATIAGNRSVGAVAGLLEPGTTVRHVSVNGSVSGEINVGVLVGAIENSSVQTASTSGSATGSNDVGGLAGQNVGGVITQSSSQAAATATGAEQGGDFARAGGLVGGNFNNGIINRSYATGSVSGGKAGGITGENFNGSRITDTYAAGNVDGRTARSTGGVVGDNIRTCPFRTTDPRCENYKATTVADSYWDKQATGQTMSAGGVGLTSVEMQGRAAQTNMTGLEFGNTWQTVTGDYPELAALSHSNRNDDESESVSRFDTNGEAGIQRGEVVDAIVTFNSNGTIGGESVSRDDIVDLIVEFNS